MAKEKKQALTSELIERLSQDGYCFDADHAKEIESLKSDLERVQRECEEKISKSVQENAATLKAKSDRAYDLEDEVKKLKEENDILRDMYNEESKKVETAAEDVRKQLKKEQKCFDFLHGAFTSQEKVPLSVPELLSFARVLMERGPTAGLPGDDRIIVMFNSSLRPSLDRALTMVDAMMAAIDDFVSKKRGDIAQELKSIIQRVSRPKKEEKP